MDENRRLKFFMIDVICALDGLPGIQHEGRELVERKKVNETLGKLWEYIDKITEPPAN